MRNSTKNILYPQIGSWCENSIFQPRFCLTKQGSENALAPNNHRSYDYDNMGRLKTVKGGAPYSPRRRPGLKRMTTINMPIEKKIQGPASYFPSIEKTYGKPISYWLEIIDSMKPLKHMEQVNQLKSAHQIGHGHANALVAFYRAR